MVYRLNVHGLRDLNANHALFFNKALEIGVYVPNREKKSSNERQ